MGKYEFREINIDDKRLFDNYLLKNAIVSSELTFTNFFMWRNYYTFKFAEINDFLCVIVTSGVEPFAVLPIGEFEQERFTEAVSIIEEYFLENNWQLVFKRVVGEQLKSFVKFLKMFDKKINKKIFFDRDNSDYVYKTENLINLKGKKYHGKRNHINKFKMEYEYEYVKINSTNVYECNNIIDQLLYKMGNDEVIADREIINNYDKLGVTGALVKVDGNFEAFTIGEKLSNNMAVIHIERVNVNIHGLANFINQQFCKNEWNTLEFINREQDLGIENLRKAKTSYHPEKLIKKYFIEW